MTYSSHWFISEKMCILLKKFYIKFIFFHIPSFCLFSLFLTLLFVSFIFSFTTNFFVFIFFFEFQLIFKIFFIIWLFLLAFYFILFYFQTLLFWGKFIFFNLILIGLRFPKKSEINFTILLQYKLFLIHDMIIWYGFC